MTTTYGYGSPVNRIKPLAINDIFRDTTSKVDWRATGLTRHDWERLESDVGGGGTGGAIVRGPFEFAYDTPGLNNGVEIFTPNAGDLLLAMYVFLDPVWNAAAQYDVGAFDGTTEGIFGGMQGGSSGGINLDDSNPSFGLFSDNASASLARNDLFLSGGEAVYIAELTADPFLLVVSTNGIKGASASSATAGAARLYIVTATPTPLD